MDAQRHSFSLRASFDQRLSLVCFSGVCFSAFLAWPAIENTYFQFIKWLIASVVLLLFIAQWRKLTLWSLAFWIDESGRCAFTHASCLEVNAEPDKGLANSLNTLWVSPWIVAFHLCTGQENSGQNKHLVLVWRDMLDDTSYRHLCRLLLRFGKSKRDES